MQLKNLLELVFTNMPQWKNVSFISHSISVKHAIFRTSSAVTQQRRCAKICATSCNTSPGAHQRDRKMCFNIMEDVDDINVDITSFIDYVTEQWLEGTDRQFWNNFENKGPKSNSILEGWHSKINNQLNTSHPNIYRLMSVHQIFKQANNEDDIIQATAGAKHRPREVHGAFDQRLTQMKSRNIGWEYINSYFVYCTYLTWVLNSAILLLWFTSQEHKIASTDGQGLTFCVLYSQY